MAKIEELYHTKEKVTIKGSAGNGIVFEVEAPDLTTAISLLLDQTASYDSEAATLKHIRMVQENLNNFARHLLLRGEVHDDSKLGEEEKPHFDRESQNLKELEVNTPEYKESLKRLQTALKHHYAVNSHHPEFHECGVADMNLVDLVEMWCDWVAASKRGKTGLLDLESCFERFHFDPQLANIFRQTAKYFNVTTMRDVSEGRP